VAGVVKIFLYQRKTIGHLLISSKGFRKGFKKQVEEIADKIIKSQRQTPSYG
jgi:hypothetical protein